MRPSRRLLVAGCITATGAVIACGLAVESHGPGRAGLAAVTLALAIWIGARAFLCLGRRSVVGLTWNRTGDWRLQLACGRSVSARLGNASMLFGSWTLIAWADAAGRRYYAVLHATDVAPQKYATLRSRLRLERL